MSRSNDPVPVETRLQMVLAVMSGESRLPRPPAGTASRRSRSIGGAPIDDGGALAMETAASATSTTASDPTSRSVTGHRATPNLGITGGASV